MSKRQAVGTIFLLFFLAQRVFAISDDCLLAEKSVLIVRARLHIQQKNLLNPTTKKEYRVPIRLEIIDVLKKGDEGLKQVELTDVYPDTNPKWDADVWMKKYRVFDGKDVLVFLQKTYLRIPVADPQKDDSFVPMYYLTPFGSFVYDPSPDALRLYSASAAKTVHDCLYAPTPTPPPVPEWALKAIEKTDFSFIKTAIHRPDNDMDIGPSLKGKKVEIPKKIRAVLQTEAKEDFGGLVKFIAQDSEGSGVKEDEIWDYYGLHPLKTYGPVYLVKAPNGLEVYVLMNLRSGSMGGWSYGLLLYDPKTGKASKSATWISGKWLDGLDKDLRMFEGDRCLTKPMISFDDINSDGQKALVVEERVHNGTMVNAGIYHYFFIEKDLSLKEVLELEARLLNLNDESTWFYRRITARKKNELTVKVTLEGDGKSSTPIGTIVLKSDGNDAPFKMDHKNVTNGEYKDFMFFSEDDEYFR